MRNLLDRLGAGDTLVADGGLGSMLLARGLGSGRCPESVNLEELDALEEIAASYLAAGADIVTTNTFGGSSLKLAPYDLDGEMERVNERGAAAVRRAVGDRAFVAGSCGSTGQLLEPYGTAKPDDVRAAFDGQLRVLIGAGVDVVFVETMIDLPEATLAVEAARAISPDIPIVASMTFDPTPRGFFTVMGVDIATAARELTAAGANVVGSNCGRGSDDMVEVAREFRRHTDGPLIIQPNAGLPELEDGRAVYRETPAYMAERAKALMAIGVGIIGGCCGTTPEHIAALRAVVDDSQPARQ